MGKITHKDAADMSTAHRVSEAEWKADTTHLDSQGNALELARTATLIVAASDSSAKSKAGADYVCDGIADQVDIQAAIDALPAVGGRVILLEGQFNISATIVLGDGTQDQVTFEGQGNSTLLLLVDNADCHVIETTATSPAHNIDFRLKNFLIGGNKANQTVAVNGIELKAVTKLFIDNVTVGSCKQHGIRILDNAGQVSTSIKIHHCHLTGNGADGLRLGDAVGDVGDVDLLDDWFGTNNYGVYSNGCRVNAVGCWFDLNAVFNVYLYQPYGCSFVGCTIDHSGQHGFGYVNISGLTREHTLILVGNFFTSNGTDTDDTYYDLYFDPFNICHGVQVIGNVFGSIEDNKSKYNIYIERNPGNLHGIIANNYFADAQTNVCNETPTTMTNMQIRDNQGYITENSGTATLVNGTTSIAVNHGLAVTPVAGDIVVTPIEAWGAMTQFYIDTYTSTQFTIHADQDPGQDVDFAWKAVVL